jgi:hypothetical protein
MKQGFPLFVWGGTKLEMTGWVRLICGWCMRSVCDGGGGVVGGFSLTMVRDDVACCLVLLGRDLT